MFIQVGDDLVVRNAESMSSLERTRSDELKTRWLTEAAAEYDLDPVLIKKNAKEKPISQLLDKIRAEFKGVSEAEGWETEQDVADYINTMRRGEIE